MAYGMAISDLFQQARPMLTASCKDHCGGHQDETVMKAIEAVFAVK
jgi:hypothetical protein